MAETTPEVVETQEAKPVVESLSDRLTKSVTEKWGTAAAEESSTEKVEDTPEAKAADTPETPVEAKKDEWTAEQFRDPKFYDRLDKAGWERLESEYPEVYWRVKAAYSAASKLYDEARKAKPEPKPAEARTDAPTQTLSPEVREALRKIDSLDETERAEGLDQYVKLKMREALPEFGFDPEEAKATRLAAEAYSHAVAELPDLDNLDLKALDAAVEADPVLLALVKTGTVQNVALAMKRAGETLIDQKKRADAETEAKRVAEEAKKAEQQRKVKSNASNVSAVIADSPVGGPPKGKETIEQFVHRKVREAQAVETAG